jgi:ABC-2 type transport system permease protein
VTTLETERASKGRAKPASSAGRSRPFRIHVIGAIFKRNLQSYFSNPAGYVFITLFVLISSCMAFWQDLFFSSNLANLDQLNRFMPYLLLFFIPAITMSSWADERRQGTEELLLTLPAHDLDVVLGKYFAAVGIFTVALLFSLSHFLILRLVGDPDSGVLFSTYLGYWLMGILLIAVGMVASVVSSNVTVAFILGAVFCSIPIFLGDIIGPMGETLRRQFELVGLVGPPRGESFARQVEAWSVPAQFQDFGTGVITLAGFAYFFGLAAVMLYLNMMLIGRRHWAGGEESKGRWVHSTVRFLALLLALFSLNILIGQMSARADMSAEKLHTLSPQSLELIQQIPAEKPVLIQCFYSPRVPREYVEVKADVLGLLKEYASRSGGKIRLNLVPTEVYSDEARDAEKRFNIEPRNIVTLEEGRQRSDEIFLGVAFTSGLEEVVIPFFDRGLPVEYEITRSIRVVSRSGRKKVGILGTDAKLMGGFDMRSFNQNPEWSIVTELKKQYDVTAVSPDTPISSDINVLLVAQPSSLTQRQIDNLTAYTKNGGATLLFLDPLPTDTSLSPELPRQAPGGPFGGQQQPEPKGNLKPYLEMIGIEWPSVDIVWNPYNPHPQLELPLEIVFIGKGSGAKDAFNPEQIASSGLQEVVTLFPGLLRPRAGASGTEFVPLLRTNNSGGTELWSEITQSGFMGNVQINLRGGRHIQSGASYTLAARVTGTPAPSPAETVLKKDEKEKKDDKNKASAAQINVIAIADLDMISEQFFDLRRRKIENLDFDNVSFVLNSVDVLAGDDSFVALRKKRPKHRTLEVLEAQATKFKEDFQAESRISEDEAKKELDDAQKAFDKQVEAVRSRKDLDDRTKEIQLAILQDTAQRRLDVKKATIEDAKQIKIRESKAQSERKIRQIQNQVRFEAAALPPLPPLILGLFVWIARMRRENVGASPKRLA